MPGQKVSDEDCRLLREIVQDRVMLVAEQDLCILAYMDLRQRYRWKREKPPELEYLVKRIAELEAKIKPIRNKALSKKFDMPMHRISMLTTSKSRIR